MNNQHKLWVAASLLLVLIPSGCSPEPTPQEAQRDALRYARNAQHDAQEFIDSMSVVCKDGREYLVQTGFRDNVVTTTGELCVSYNPSLSEK